MTINFSARVERVEPSATLAISDLATELESDGIDVIDLSVGEPDFPTPANIVAAGKQALDDGHTGYAPSKGVPELRTAIADSLSKRGLSYTSDEIIVTPGAKQALYETFQAVVESQEEVVLLDPAWVSYEAMAKLAGGSISRVDLSSSRFQLEGSLDALTETVSSETKLLVINSPSNPSGAVFSDAALQAVRDLAVDHDFLVISDEIYDAITYGVDPTSLGSLDGMNERTITINGFSKAYAMTGWRLGYLAAPSELIQQAGKLHSHSVSSATHFVQYAGVAALSDTDDAVEEMRQAFEDRRDMLIDEFAEYDLSVPVGDGAFYMMLPVSDDDQAWCENVLENAHVATVPGSAFGTPGYARISYAASEDRLREAVSRLADSGFI